MKDIIVTQLKRNHGRLTFKFQTEIDCLTVCNAINRGYTFNLPDRHPQPFHYLHIEKREATTPVGANFSSYETAIMECFGDEFNLLIPNGLISPINIIEIVPKVR